MKSIVDPEGFVWYNTKLDQLFVFTFGQCAETDIDGGVYFDFYIKPKNNDWYFIGPFGPTWDGAIYEVGKW